MRWFLKEANSPGEAQCKKSWDRFEEDDSLSLRYVKQVSGKRKNHRLEKYKSKILISEVRPYAMKFEDRSHEETERQQRCARRKAWNPAKKTYTSSKKIHGCILFPAEEWVLLAASAKEPEEREFVVDSGAK